MRSKEEWGWDEPRSCPLWCTVTDHLETRLERKIDDYRHEGQGALFVGENIRGETFDAEVRHHVGSLLWWRLVLQRSQARREAKAARSGELTSACKEIISASQKLMFKSSALHVNMQIRSGIWENIDVLLHTRKPADILEINDYLMVEQGKILDARATIWLIGDETLIKGADEIISAVQSLITASTALPTECNDLESDGIAKVINAATRNLKPLKHDLKVELEISQSAHKLWRACVAFGLLMREKLKIDDVDALIRAFPNYSLLEPPDDADDDEPDTKVADWQL